MDVCPAVHPFPVGPEPHFLSSHAGRCLLPGHPHALVHVTVGPLFKPLLPVVPSQGPRFVPEGGSTAMCVLLGVPVGAREPRPGLCLLSGAKCFMVCTVLTLRGEGQRAPHPGHLGLPGGAEGLRAPSLQWPAA